MKVLYLLNIDDYAPEVCKLTYPLIRYYARKIGAEICEIRERRFPEWPVAYEKLQIYELAQRNGAEWHIYVDSDALVHPETPDWTCFLSRDTVAHNGTDFANLRWRYDEYFLRDGRNIGSCNWLTIASSWCLDLWRPLADLTPEGVADRIYPTAEEMRSGVVEPSHLVDDYALSRNIARFGLKVTTLQDLEKRLGFDKPEFFWHLYALPLEQKLDKMRETLKRWNLDLAKVGIGDGGR